MNMRIDQARAHHQTRNIDPLNPLRGAREGRIADRSHLTSEEQEIPLSIDSISWIDQATILKQK
jgi:hypothetical protein